MQTTSTEERARTEERSRTARTAFKPALSGLRGVSSLAVVLFHASVSLPFFLGAITSTFYLGVPVFLMMSMYLLLNTLDSGGGLRRYFVRRIVRIWPVYYGTLVVFYLLFPYPLVDFLRYLFFIEYYVNPLGYFPVSVFWTLQLEEAMYLFIPLIHTMSKGSRRALGVAFVGVGVAFLSLVSTTPLGIQSIVYLQMLLPVCLIAYGLGILAKERLIPPGLRALAPAAVAALVLLSELRAYSVMHFYTYYFTVNVFLYLAALIGFASILADPPGILRWFAFIGEESYALYAVHYAFLTLFGLAGIAYAVGVAFAVEFTLRPKEFLRRLRLSYPALDARVREQRRREPGSFPGNGRVYRPGET